LVALVLIAGAAGSASAQVRAEDLRQALARLRESTDRIARLNGAVGRMRTEELHSAIEWLNNRIASTDTKNVSREYLRSLQRAAELLDLTPSQGVVDDVQEELEAKVEHCKMLGIGMGGSVLVRIDTRRSSGPVSDWQVLSLLKIYERVNGASPVTFPKLSTPTESRLDPGRYWVWAREPATGRTTERTLVRVVGQKELLVDLPVP
jgi:hypothetical protein